MKKLTTSDRLKQLMAARNLKQVDILRKAEPFCEKYNIRVGKNDLSQYVNGKVEPGQDKLSILAMALDVSEAWLMGYDVQMDRTPAPLDAKITYAREREALQGPGYRMLLDPDSNLTEADLEDIKEFIAFKQRKYGR